MLFLTDVSTFLLIKVSAFFALFIIAGIAPFVGVLISFYAAPPGKWANRIWKIVTAPIAVLAVIVYSTWIWPGDLPRTVNSQTHFVGAFWNNLIDNYEEYQKRWQKTPDPVRVNEVTQLRRFEVVSWNPPKHFYITLKDTETGALYESVYVSKHCNLASSLKHGEQYNIKITNYELNTMPGKPFYVFVDLYSTFCSV